jgi:hypothetical protein
MGNQFKEGVVLLREPFKPNRKLIKEAIARAEAQEELESHDWYLLPVDWHVWKCRKCGVEAESTRPSRTARVYVSNSGSLKLANGGIGPGMTCEKAVVWKVMET